MIIYPAILSFLVAFLPFCLSSFFIFSFFPSCISHLTYPFFIHLKVKANPILFWYVLFCHCYCQMIQMSCDKKKEKEKIQMKVNSS